MSFTAKDKRVLIKLHTQPETTVEKVIKQRDIILNIHFVWFITACAVLYTVLHVP